MSDGARKSLADQLAATLRRRILSDQLAPGERLPAERQLAQELSTNRNTLREAIRQLEALGIVHARHGQGVTVQPFRDEGQLNLLPYFLIEGSDPVERLHLLEDMLLVRRVVLGEAVALAAERGGAAAGPALRRLLRRLEETVDRGEVLAIMQADLALYREIIRATGSLAICWTFNTFHALYRAGMEQLAAFWTLPGRYVDGLRRLVDTIGAADPEAARAALLDHLDRGDLEVMEKLRSLLGEGRAEEKRE